MVCYVYQFIFACISISKYTQANKYICTRSCVLFSFLFILAVYYVYEDFKQPVCKNQFVVAIFCFDHLISHKSAQYTHKCLYILHR